MSTRKSVYLVLGSAAALALVTAAPAAAHVTVQPGEASQGSYTKLAFRVPNESETAGTIKLEVAFPQDTPLASLRTKPVPGWTADIRKEKLATPVDSGHGEITEAVRTITWTAQPGVRIGPGEFMEFEVSGGPMPDTADQLLLPATQTYDDGTVVKWDAPPPEEGTEGAEEPEHPAPVLRLMAGTADDHGSAAAPAAESHAASGASTTAASGPDRTARWLGGAGLVVGALGLGLAGGALIASRRRGAGGSGTATPDS
jgi:periplasmic copper chaperone A